MGSFQDLSPGVTFTTPGIHIDDDDASALIRIGGYTHPLFTDPAYAAASPFGRSPLPGEAVLHLMGGAVEQSGRFDETVVALTGFDGVRFWAPAFGGDTLYVVVEVTGRQVRPSGKRGEVTMSWRCRNERGEMLVEANVTMLFRV